MILGGRLNERLTVFNSFSFQIKDYIISIFVGNSSSIFFQSNMDAVKELTYP